MKKHFCSYWSAFCDDDSCLPQFYCNIYFSSMALISNSVTHGTIMEEQLDEAFSTDHRSVEPMGK